MQAGSSSHRVTRVISTQKLPTVLLWLRAKPRMKAKATAMPVAADRKFCTAKPAICEKYDIVDSPA